MESQINIGDKVRLIKNLGTIGKHPSLSVGDEGTIVDITKKWHNDKGCGVKLYGIDWGKTIDNGHEFSEDGRNPLCESEHGSYVQPEEIEVIGSKEEGR